MFLKKREGDGKKATPSRPRSEKEIEELAKSIRPVVRRSTREDPIGSLHWIEPPSLDLEAFPSRATVLGPADNLEAMATMKTNHHSPDGFFRPTIGAVLKQIPEELLPFVAAFEVTTALTSKIIKHDDRPHRYFAAKTILYRRKETAKEP